MPSAFFPLDVNFFDHPKVVPLGDGAVRLELSAIAYANRLMTDGFIARPIPGRLGGSATYAAELVRAVLWHEADVPCPRGHATTCPEFPGVEGWRIHDFLEHNRSKEERLRTQEFERDRKAAYRERQRKERNDRDNTVSGDAAVPRDTSVPGMRDTAVPGTPRGRLIETETETETETRVPPSAGRVATATPATVTPIPTAQTFIAAYVDAYRGRTGHDPPSRVKGQLARELSQLIADGIPTDAVKAGLVAWFDADTHPRTLSSFVEVEARGGRPRARPTRQQQGRAQLIETDQVLDRWAANQEGGWHGQTRVADTGPPAERQLPRPGATP